MKCPMHEEKPDINNCDICFYAYPKLVIRSSIKEHIKDMSTKELIDLNEKIRYHMLFFKFEEN